MATKRFIYYRDGYKYQLSRDYKIQLPIKIIKPIKTKLITLHMNGVLLIRKNYAWDGPSGPVFDSPETMRASLVHDALYQLMRRKKLSPDWRSTADLMFKRLCIEDGVADFTANIYYKALKSFGGQFADPKSKKKIIKAPKELK